MSTDDDGRRRGLARRTARVLLLDAAERLLLFRMAPPSGGAEWLTPGGGVGRGEPLAAAAARELWEETGLRAAPAELGRPVALTGGYADLGWKRGRFEDVFFLHRVDTHEVDTGRMEPYERGTTTGHRWWPVAELATTAERVIPLGLPELLPGLLAGRLPAEPVRLPWHH
ncbi:NUDIX hydrolase [Streptomyces hainanensis]|uniref:NUDIX domain-containing protein n=1 Tax=Streptomyces hainanensis TaxID=402648 RepID=A0A4V2Y496_9ACTN|nr:NUDIX domain-containing protein [Streptomyces hainanensis]TDC79565.1 NUDIX domain-containing protein [Streptomyces hainanensis]